MIEKHRPTGSTSEVIFRTVRPAVGTQKSHISHVVLDSIWEQSAAFQLERISNVVTYARNDHLDLTIPYQWQGTTHHYYPDFVVHWSGEDGITKILLEIKGLEDEQDRQKQTGALRWVRAVNHHGGFGQWGYALCRNPRRVEEMLQQTVTECSTTKQ